MADDHFPATFSAGFFKRRARLQKSSRARRLLEQELKTGSGVFGSGRTAFGRER
jgi:hypothetical protein